MIDLDLWPGDYVDSRERFIDRARRAGARLDSSPNAATGPRGEALSMDTAVLGAPGAAHRIIMISGVHGVEGFLGACAQLHALRRIEAHGLPDDTGVALVHAVNPWGFAQGRRVDEDNVDLNRNFIEATGDRPRSDLSAYAALDPLINPRVAPSRYDRLVFWVKAGRLIGRERGIEPLARAIAEGQDGFPKGLFYGGRQPGAATRALQRRLVELAAGADRITLLDVHSGLGPRAAATLIARTNIGSSHARGERLRTHYGQGVVEDGAPGNVYDAVGTLARWLGRTLEPMAYLYLCVEIGTAHPLAVLSALRRENQAYHWTPVGSRARAAARQALLDVFAPRSRRWRRDSLAQVLQSFDRSLALPVDPHANGVPP